MINHVQIFFKLYLVDQTSKIFLTKFSKKKQTLYRLYELAVRHLDLDSLLEFFEQIRLLTETPVSKRTSDISPSLPQNLFPMHVVIERIGDMTLGNKNQSHLITKKKFLYRNYCITSTTLSCV